MIKEFKNRLPKRKLNVFLICLTCSFMAWLVSKLSETHTDTTSFELYFTNVPDSLILNRGSVSRVNVRVRASGFQFLRFHFGNKRLGIDLSEIRHGEDGYILPLERYRDQIESQLPGTMTLLDMDKDTLFLDVLKVQARWLPVRADIRLDLGQNYILDGPLELKPDSVLVRGPKSEIDSIGEVKTTLLDLHEVTEDFIREVPLRMPGNLTHTVFEPEKVSISGRVVRFSEKIVNVPVEVIRLPQGTEIRTFPNTIPVLCKAGVDRLKAVDAQDFRLVADYSMLEEGQSSLQVRLLEIPEAVHSAQLMEERVEFILKRE